MNHRGFIRAAICLCAVFVLLVALVSLLAAVSRAGPALAGVELYQPVAEIKEPTGSRFLTRAVEEKDGYAYLLTKTGILYTYDIRDLPARSGFATYGTPVYSQTVGSDGNGVLRYGDYLYVFGGDGLTTLSVHHPEKPALLRSRADLRIHNLIRHENLLVAPGNEALAVYSLADPANPALVSRLALGEVVPAYAAAVYGQTLYTGQYNPSGIGIYDFSDPAHLVAQGFIPRDDMPYHLRLIGNRMIEAGSDIIGLWDLSAPAAPAFLTSMTAGGRVCALHGSNIITNGYVHRLQGNALGLVARFTPGGGQLDGVPYGSASNSSFVFLAQSPRVLVLRAMRGIYLPLALR